MKNAKNKTKNLKHFLNNIKKANLYMYLWRKPTNKR